MLRLTSVVTALVVLISVPALAEKVVPQNRAQVEYSYAPLIKQVSPAVVNIYTKRIIRRSRRSPFEGSIFEHFFGDRIGQVTRFANHFPVSHDGGQAIALLRPDVLFPEQVVMELDHAGRALRRKE